MKIVTNHPDTITIEFTDSELRLVAGVLAEVRSGPNAFDDDDWGMLIGRPRETEQHILEVLARVLEARNQFQTNC